MAVVIELVTKGVARQFKFPTKGILHIGRSSDNHIQIVEPDVSTKHCVLILKVDIVLLEDQESKNGTFINGENVKKKTIYLSDIIQVGESYLRVNKDYLSTSEYQKLTDPTYRNRMEVDLTLPLLKPESIKEQHTKQETNNDETDPSITNLIDNSFLKELQDIAKKKD